MKSVNENMLHVSEYKVLGKLPDLMTFDDGTPVSRPEDWEKRRKELYPRGKP